MTREECKQACNDNLECAAFGEKANVSRSPCCLSMEGNRGNGDSRRKCWVKQTGIFGGIKCRPLDYQIQIIGNG